MIERTGDSLWRARLSSSTFGPLRTQAGIGLASFRDLIQTRTKFAPEIARRRTRQRPLNPRNTRTFSKRPDTPGNGDSGWLGRQDSNLGMAESKSAALPLGYAPNAGFRRRGARTIAARFHPINGHSCVQRYRSMNCLESGKRDLQ